MTLGNVSNSVQTGGASAGGSGDVDSRTIIALGVSPKGTEEAMLGFASSTGVRAALDTGPLAEYLAKLFQHKAPVAYGVPVTPSSDGDIGAVSQTGTGAGTVTVTVAPHKKITVLCSTGGTLGTMKVRFSLDDGVTYTDPYTSTSSSYVVRVPGTFCTLTFAAATYVATKLLTVAVDGTVTAGSGWVGTVTQASSPIDNYDVLLEVITGGALGTAVLRPSLDGGKSTLPNVAIPTGGVVVLAGTGLVLTCANTFVAGDTYSFLAAPPGFSTSDISDAMTALMADPDSPTVAVVHVIGLPSSASGAISLASTLSTAIATAAATYKKQWMGVAECPSSVSEDTVISGGAAIADTADTDSVIRAARDGQTFNYVSVFVGTNRMPSAIKPSLQLRRPTGWAVMARYVEDVPRADVSEVGRGALDITEIGRDEFVASTQLHDAQFNVLRTYPGLAGAYLAIESGGVGWRNMTTDADFQDAGAVRVLLVFLAAITTAGQKYLGSRQPTNEDGTVAEGPRQAISADLDGVGKRSVGLLKGGSFVDAQASTATAEVLASSQLGQAPKRLDVQYSLQSLGLVSAVSNNVNFSGVVSI